LKKSIFGQIFEKMTIPDFRIFFNVDRLSTSVRKNPRIVVTGAG